MNPLEHDNLAAAERRAFTMKFRDGLHDLQVGLILLVVYGFMGLREHWATWWVLPGYILLTGAITGGFFLARKNVARPRIGTMKPLPARRKRSRIGALVLALFVTVQALLVLLQATGDLRPDFERVMVSLFASFIVFVPMAAIAWFSSFNRGYLHAVLVGVSTGSIIAFDTGVFFLVSGLVILTVGMVVLVRFLREFPLPDEAAGQMPDEAAGQMPDDAAGQVSDETAGREAGAFAGTGIGPEEVNGDR